MFGISFPELVVIVVLILVVMGPEKIPDVARTLGKAMREVRRASNLMRDTLMLDEDEYERNRARRIRQAERASARSIESTETDQAAAASDAAGVAEAQSKTKPAEVRPVMSMPGGSLDQVDDEMLTASFEKALQEMYGPADGGLRQVPIPLRRHELVEGAEQEVPAALREVTLAVQGAAPGCRDVHLVVGEKSAEVTW